RAKCVLIATGVKWRKLPAKNADRFDMAGVYHAATTVESRMCEGGAVCVVGGGNSAGQAAMFLSDSCPEVHLLVRGGDFAASMSDYLASRIRENPRIRIHLFTEIEEVLAGGDGNGRGIGGVEVVNKETGRRERINCCAVFVFIGAE